MRKKKIELPEIENPGMSKIPSVMKLRLPGKNAYYDRISAMYTPNKGMDSGLMMTNLINEYCGITPESLEQLNRQIEWTPAKIHEEDASII